MALNAVRQFPGDAAPIAEELLRIIDQAEETKDHPFKAEDLGDVLFTYALTVPFFPLLQNNFSLNTAALPAGIKIKTAVFVHAVFQAISESAIHSRKSKQDQYAEKEIRRQQIRAEYRAFVRLLTELHMRYNTATQIAFEREVSSLVRTIASKA